MKFVLIAVLAAFAAPLAHADFKNDAELGLIVTNGNTKTQSLSLKDATNYTWEKNVATFTGNFLRAEQNDALSAKNWGIGLRYEREIHALLNAFAAQQVEADRFAGIRQRYNSDLGAKYFLRKLDKDFIWFFEAGYRFTKQNNTSGTVDNFQKARVYGEAEKFWSPTTSTKLWVEFQPNFTLSRAWLLNSEASVSSALSSVFAIKTAYLVRINNLPPVAAGKTDTSFTTSLVAKF